MPRVGRHGERDGTTRERRVAAAREATPRPQRFAAAGGTASDLGANLVTHNAYSWSTWPGISRGHEAEAAAAAALREPSERVFDDRLDGGIGLEAGRQPCDDLAHLGFAKAKRA